MKQIVNALFNAVLAKLLIKATLLIFAAIVVATPFCVTAVKDYELVVVRKWGKRVDGAVEPGPRWFWPIQNTVHRYDTRPQHIELKGAFSPGEPMGIGARTRDRRHVGLVTTIHYTLDSENWEAIDDNFGSDDSAESRQQIETRIVSEVRHAIQNLVPQYELEYLHSHRGELIHDVLFTLELTNTEEPGSQTDMDDQPIIIVPPTPLPIERLQAVGIVIKYLEMQLDTPDGFEQEMDELAAIEADEKKATAKAPQLVQEKLVAAAEQEIANIWARASAEHELEMLQAKSQAAPLTSFLDKWDWRLPQVIVVGSDTSPDLVNDLLQSHIGEAGAEPNAQPVHEPNGAANNRVNRSGESGGN